MQQRDFLIHRHPQLSGIDVGGLCWTVSMTQSTLADRLASPGVHPVREHADVERLRAMLDSLSGVDGDRGEIGPRVDGVRVDMLGLLEQVKGAAAAAQARVTLAFEQSQLAQQDAAGVRREQGGRGIADQVALARGCAASQGSRHLGFAKAMAEMPHTLALLDEGRITEWTATLLVRETATLIIEDRQRVDERLCAMTVDTHTGEVAEPLVLDWTPRRVERAARALAVELDPEAAVRRAAKATGERRVTIRPTPDTMTYVTALVPVAQGVATWANLSTSAKGIKAAGDQRSESQIMADLFVTRLTGQPTAEAVPMEIQMTMTPDALVGPSEQPAAIGDAVLPAQIARDLVLRDDAPRWLRRLFTDPVTGTIVEREPHRHRFFPTRDARFLDVRDQRCRHPFCDSPICDHDHVVRVADGGLTTRANGQGLCEGHNLVKELPGWRARVVDPNPGRHTVEVTTPTGHRYRSRAPSGLPPPL